MGVIETVKNGWVIINWSRASGGRHRWGTPLDVVLFSIMRREWAFTDWWCSELEIPD